MNRQQAQRIGFEAHPPAGLGFLRVHPNYPAVAGRPSEPSSLQCDPVAVLRFDAVVEELGDHLGERRTVDEQREFGVDVGRARVEIVAPDPTYRRSGWRGFGLPKPRHPYPWDVNAGSPARLQQSEPRSPRRWCVDRGYLSGWSIFNPCSVVSPDFELGRR